MMNGSRSAMKWKRLIAYVCIIALTVTGLSFVIEDRPAKADASGEAYVYISSGSTAVTIGTGFDATFTIQTSGDSIGVVFGTINYDPSVLSCAGYSGTIPIPESMEVSDEELYSWSISYHFDVIGAGQSSLSVSFGVETLRGEQLSNIASSVLMSASYPYVASSDSSLTALLTSEGYVDVNQRSYTINVPYTTSTFALNPTKSDPKASWGVVSGSDFLNNLQVGTNTIVLRVIAEDGVNFTDYTFYVVRAEDPASKFTPTPVITNTPTPTGTPTPTHTPEPALEVKSSNGSTLSLVRKTDLEAPYGYTKKDYEYEGETVTAAVLGDEEQVLLCLKSASGTQGWYVYDPDKKVCDPCVAFNSTGYSYLLVDMPNDQKVPNGYEEVTPSFSGTKIRCFQSTEKKDEYLVNLLNKDGEYGIFRYNSTAKQTYPYVPDATGSSDDVPKTTSAEESNETDEVSTSEQENTLTEEAPSESTAAAGEDEAMKAKFANYEGQIKRLKKIVYGAMVVMAAILLAAVVALCLLFRKGKKEPVEVPVTGAYKPDNVTNGQQSRETASRHAAETTPEPTVQDEKTVIPVAAPIPVNTPDEKQQPDAGSSAPEKMPETEPQISEPVVEELELPEDDSESFAVELPKSVSDSVGDTEDEVVHLPIDDDQEVILDPDDREVNVEDD